MRNMLSALFMVILGPASLLAVEYHVAKNGSDGATGGAGTPWLTIQKAANTVVAGDIVRVHTGTYEEQVAESTDGSAGSPITYVADGAVVVRGFNISGDYIRVIGFEITHAVPTSAHGIVISNAAHVQILDCNIHNTGDGLVDSYGISISPAGAPYLILRGNTLSYSGSPGNNNGPGMKSINDSGAPSTSVLIEYNDISHTTDFVCSNGDYFLARNNVLGPSLVTDFGGTPHVDGWQANAQTRYGFMEANWHVDNSVSDSHMILIEAPVSGANGHFAVVKNVSLRSGDHLWFQMRDGDNLHAAHNSVGQIGFGPRGGPGSSGFFYVWSENTPSNGNCSLNNIFYDVTTGVVYTVNAGSDLTHSHDHVDVGNDITNGVNGNIKSDPVTVSWTNYGADDLTLKSAAPDRDSGAALTTVSSLSGTGSSFTVVNPDWFYDGFTLTEGQKIAVGDDNNLTITAVEYALRRITVSSSFSWSSGDPVSYAYRGSGPDLGAYEYGDTLLSAAMLSSIGNDYAVTTVGDARFVVFYRDGIPYVTDYSEPYTATILGGAVTARAYALHAQAHPVIIAQGGGPATPAVSIGDRSVTEGDAGDVVATFTVSLSAPTTMTVTVPYQTADGTATAGEDYLATLGTITFDPGATSQTLQVVVRGDTAPEPDETFRVVLGTASNATVADGEGLGLIRNDDAAVPTGFHRLPPCRVIDTRSTGGAPALTPNATRNLLIGGACGVPPSARVVSLNVTATQPSAGGHLRLFPGGQPMPLSSAINFHGGQTRANSAIVGLGPGGMLSVYSAAATVHLILDVNGYFD